MDRKTNLLSNLKKQVLALKSQLQVLEHGKQKISKARSNNSHHQSMSTSSRFDSVTFDSTYLDKGVKKFPLGEIKFKNIAEIIKEKSDLGKTPKISQYRRSQLDRTKQNFSTQRVQTSPYRPRTPNPVTGQGYSDKKHGIKTGFSTKRVQTQKISHKKHYHYQF